ncbi:MAG: DUF3048 C-terminal domain-containing protein [Clostridiaceae bacterium]
MIDRKPLNTKDFFLFFSLTIIIILILYSHTAKYAERFLYKPPQGNALNVSPLTGEEIDSVLQKDEAYMAIYGDDIAINEMALENQGDIIFESYDDTSDKCIYRGLYYESSPYSLQGVERIDSIAINSLPTFSFKDSSEKLPVYYKDSGDLIHIEYSKAVSTTFRYEEGYYKYSSSLEKSNAPIVSNLIIQLVDKANQKSKGNAIILSGGKACSGTWEKINNTTLIKDYKGLPMTLIEGKSWWITVIEGSLILIE